MAEKIEAQPLKLLPDNANLCFHDVITQVKGGQRLALYLDFDGTLVPLVPHPDDVRLPPAVRSDLIRLAGVVPVALVSGRDREDVARHVDIYGLIYAGSHGFDIYGPGLHYTVGDSFLPSLDGAEVWLRESLADVEGALVERKRFGIALHTRMVAPAFHQRVQEAAVAAFRAYPGLRLTEGKEVFELRPDVSWDKGQAVLKLQRHLAERGEEFVPLFIGDDLTDEDAIRAISGQGIAIRVTSEPVATEAGYRLDGPEDVALFLHRLCDHLGA